jgi:hypothetical protein
MFFENDPTKISFLRFPVNSMKTFNYLFILIGLITMCESANGKSNFLYGSMFTKNGQEAEIVYEDRVYADYIHTVEFYRSGWRLSVPFRTLSDTTTLILDFDDLSQENHTYTYTLIHCSSSWEPSDIPETEYLSGIPESEIRDYRFSRHALQPYTHYRLAIPNKDITPILPGNYILYVFLNYDRTRPVLTRRFFLLDPLVEIDATAHRTDNVSQFNTAQEVDFTINYERLPLDDPRRNIKVAVCQNYNWLTAKTDLQPRYIQPDRLIYEYDDINLFPGGAEFRHFDTKNLKYNSDRVREIRFQRPLMNVYLHPDEDRSGESYYFIEDINGRFFIKWEESTVSDLEADYVEVHFSLPYPEKRQGGEFYIFGGLTGFGIVPQARMAYNDETASYECKMLLKQGYYNYQHAFVDENLGRPVFNLTDGNHYETENDYYIFVYFKDIRERFERLVGLEIVNSLRKNRSDFQGY